MSRANADPDMSGMPADSILGDPDQDLGRRVDDLVSGMTRSMER
jgi:hypothetical protein